MQVVLCLIRLFSLAAGDETGAKIITQDFTEMSEGEVIKFLVTSVNRLESERVKQQERIEALEDTVEKQREVIDALQKATEKLENGKEMTHIVEDSPGSDPEEKVNRKIRNYHSSRRDIKKRVQITSGISRRAGQVASVPVAFSSLASHHMDHLGAKQNLVFDHTYGNTNYVYNPHHGVFTVPVSGVYVITATVLANTNREVWCDIAVDGSTMAWIYARGTDNRHDQGSQTILVHLKQGDDVAIRNRASDDSIFGSNYTTFSGFLLYDEETVAIIG